MDHNTLMNMRKHFRKKMKVRIRSCVKPEEHCCSAYHAYIELDCDDGSVSAQWYGGDYEEEYAIPGRVWHGRVLRWAIPAEFSEAEVDALMERLSPLFKWVLDGYTLTRIREYGNCFIGVYDSDATEAMGMIEKECENILPTPEDDGRRWVSWPRITDFSPVR